MLTTSWFVPRIRHWPASIKTSAYKEASESKFSLERPSDGCLRFLDLMLKNPGSLCWEYGKMSSKPLLPFKSSHPKSVRKAIARNLMNNAISKSCFHSIGCALQRLFDHFHMAGYPEEYVFKQLVNLVSLNKDRTRKRRRVSGSPLLSQNFS